MMTYDVLSSRPMRSTRRLVWAWCTTAALIALVLLAVTQVVRLSEKKFAYQIHREVEKMERIERRMSSRRERQQRHRQQPAHSVQPLQLAAQPAVDAAAGSAGPPQLKQNGATKAEPSRQSSSAGGSEDDGEDEADSTDSSLDDSLMSDHTQPLLPSASPALPSQSSPSSSPPPQPQRQRDCVPDAELQQKHAFLMARVKAEEDKRAVTRAVLAAASYQSEEQQQEEEEVEQALEEAMEAGLSAAEIAREASSQRRAVARHDPINRVSSSLVFLYRLCDLVCYYCIFVAVFAFQNTLQLSITGDTLLWCTLYLVALLAVTLTAMQLLEQKQEDIALSLLSQQQQQHRPSLTLRPHPAPSKKVKRLKIKQASWRKLSSYVTSSFSYLLAYAAWAVMQAAVGLWVPGAVQQHVAYLWLNAAIVLCLSGLIIVLLNVRVRSALTAEKEPQQPSEPPASAPSLLHALCLDPLITRFVKRPRASTARLHVRVDMLSDASGSVASSHSQMVTECMSYLIALSIGAALTASLPAVPADAATYTYTVQPSGRAMVAYALSCSVVLAGLTLWLERWVRRMERRNAERAREVLRQKSEGRERIGIREIVNGSRAQASEQFSANTEETALYVLRRQQQYEKKLRVKDWDEEWREREERRRRQRAANGGYGGSPSPLSALGSPPFVSVNSPLLCSPLSSSATEPQYGAVAAGGGSEPSTPLFSPGASPTASSVAASGSPASPRPASSASSIHRSLLTSTFLHEYYVAIASTLTQGCALLVAYSWTGVFAFVLFPALRRWSLLMDCSDVLIKAVWSAATFCLYFACILGAARIFHREECFEL